MSLLTVDRIHKYQWTELQVGADVFDRVEQLAIVEGQPLVVENFKYECGSVQPMNGHDEREIEEFEEEPQKE